MKSFYIKFSLKTNINMPVRSFSLKFNNVFEAIEFAEKTLKPDEIYYITNE